MNCQQFKAIFVDVVRNLENAANEQAVRDHAEKCAECGELFSREKWLTHALYDLAEEDKKIYVSETMNDKLGIAFRELHALERESPSFQWSRTSWQMAAAIAILVLGGLLLFQTRFSGTKWEQDKTPAAKVLPVLRHEASGQKLGNIQLETANTEIATEFFSLAPSNQASGSLQRVRVILPRNALLQFGLPMNEERSAEPITADLLVSEEGTPRAIRFVQQMQ
jgi:hypothetical protein